MAVVKLLCDGDVALVVTKVDSGYASAVYDLTDADVPDDPDPAAVRSQGKELLATVKGGLFESEQRNREFVNEAKEELPTELEAGFAKDFKAFAHQVAQSKQKRREVQRTETVEKLLRETEAVTVHPGEETFRRVELRRDGRTERIEFTSGEWTADSPAPLRERYDACFYETLDIDADEWRTIRDEWEDMQDVKEIEELTTATMRAETVRDILKRTLKPYADRSALADNSGRISWWVPGDETELVDDDSDGVVFVPVHVVRSAMREAGIETSHVNQLSREWRDSGAMVGTTQQRRIAGDPTRLWPFQPSRVRVDPEIDVYGLEADE
jgi:hypothetical protein